MQIRDRIRELRRVRASELRPNPRNWRLHPPEQHDALRGVLAEVGFADALLVRELDDGSLEIIDGHLRAEATPHELVPVLVLDVSADEAAKILATHDAITGMATPDMQQLERLLDECQFDNPAIAGMFAALLQSNDSTETDDSSSDSASPRDPLIESYQVVAACENEQQQRELYEQLTREGYKCRLLML